MDLDLTEILDSCLAEIRAGRRTVQQCLSDYPEHRAELEALLPLALAMATPAVRIDPRRKLAARHRLIEAIHAEPPAPWWRQVFSVMGPGSGALRFGLASAFAMLITATMVVTAAMAAQDAKPGDFLYPVRTVIEDVQVATAGAPEARARARVAIADQRLNEVERAVSNDDTATARRAAAGYEEALARAKAEIEQAHVKPEAVPELGQALQNNLRRQEIASARARERGAADTAETLERARERYAPQMQPATTDIDRVAQGASTPAAVIAQASPSPTSDLGVSATPEGSAVVPVASATPATGEAPASGATPAIRSATPTAGSLRGTTNPREIALGPAEQPASEPGGARLTATPTLIGIAGIPAPDPASGVLGPPVPPRTGPTAPAIREDDAARNGGPTRAPLDPSPAAIASDPRSVTAARPPVFGGDPSRSVEVRPTPFRPDDDDAGRSPSVAVNPRSALPPALPPSALGAPAGPSTGTAGAAAGSSAVGVTLPAAATAGAAYAAGAGITPAPIPTTSFAAVSAAPASAAMAPQGPQATPTPTRTPTPTATAKPPTATATSQAGIVQGGGQSVSQGATQSGGSGPGTSANSLSVPPAGPNSGSGGNTSSDQASPTPGH